MSGQAKLCLQGPFPTIAAPLYIQPRPRLSWPSHWPGGWACSLYHLTLAHPACFLRLLTSELLPSTLCSESPSRLASAFSVLSCSCIGTFPLIRSLTIPLTLLLSVTTLVPTLSLFFPHWSGQLLISFFCPLPHLEPPKHLFLTFLQVKHGHCLGLKNMSIEVLMFLLSRGEAYLPSSWAQAGLSDWLPTKSIPQKWWFVPLQIRL